MNTPQPKPAKIASGTPDAASAPVPDEAPGPKEVVQHEPSPEVPAATTVRPAGDPHAARQALHPQMHPATSTAGVVKGRWQQVVGAAKVTWGMLTRDELLKLDGDEPTLVGLVQKRYGVSRETAERQARQFFAIHMA